MRKLITATFAITMLVTAASCGSDDDSSSASTGAPTSEGASGDSTAVTTGDSTAVTEGDSMSGGDLSDAKQAVIDQTIEAAAAAGLTIDRDCFTAVVEQLSDEDAQLIFDAGPEGDPTLSPEGEALGTEAAKCVDTSSLPVSSDATATT